jgi:glycosyltransferase involved in cell wall biosynthesis
MPCFNHARFVRDSVDGILRQTCSDFELIIVDDCSADNSWEVIQSVAGYDPRIRVFRHERNLGASKSRNDALRVAQGKFIGFCDADDIWEPDKLRIQVNLLQNHPEFDVVYCDTIIVDENGLSNSQRFSEWFPPPRAASGWLFRELVRRNFINMQSVLMRRECVQRVGQFDEGIKWVEDWWYWIRVSHDHRLLYSQQPLARYRVHQRSTALVERRGYKANRVKVFHRILRNYPELPSKLKAEIYYHIGVALTCLGKRNYACRCFLRSVEWQRPNIRAICRLVLCLLTSR